MRSKRTDAVLQFNINKYIFFSRWKNGNVLTCSFISQFLIRHAHANMPAIDLIKEYG